MFNLKHEPRLDGLRAIAILMVLVSHFAYFIGQYFASGFYGVNLFFVLSGFLITSILIVDSDKPFGKQYIKFIGRRSLRIFPIYYLTILVLVIINAPHVFERLPNLLTYTYNWLMPNIDSEGDHFRPVWSLCVEEQFYLFFPFIAIVFQRNVKILAVICVALVLIAYSQIVFNIFGMDKYDYTGLITNMGPLCIGALGAVYQKWGRQSIIPYKKFSEIGVLIAIPAMLLAYSRTHNGMLHLLLTLCNLYLVLHAYNAGFAIGSINKLLTNKHMLNIDQVSYGMYLYHNSMQYYLTRYIFDPIWFSIPFRQMGFLAKLEFHAWIIKFPLYTLITFALASLSYKLVETPVLKLKDKYFG